MSKLEPLTVEELQAGRWHRFWQREDVPRLIATIAARDERIIELEAENICDACAGTGTPTSGKPCMCRGTGKMSDAAIYLREELVKREMEMDKLESALGEDVEKCATLEAEVKEANGLVEELSYKLDAKHAKLVEVADKLRAERVRLEAVREERDKARREVCETRECAVGAGVLSREDAARNRGWDDLYEDTPAKED